ncbi:MAG: MFS transporter [Actinomycetota bacterium]|nr:MFS transporter [Actinomycetota bacterium]
MRKALAERLPGVRRATTGAQERWSEWIGRDFRRLLGAQFAAQAADGCSQAVIANILVLEPLGQGTSGRVLEVSVLTLLPYSLIAPFLGVFVDRWARRSILVVTSGLRVLLLGAAIAALTGGAGETTLYGAALLLLGLGRLFLTAKGASLPLTLHEHHLLQGNSISGGGGMIAALAGGVVGLAAVAFSGAGPALGLAAALYLVSAAVAASIGSAMRADRRHTAALAKEIARVAVELKDGLRQAWRRPPVRLPLVAIFLLRVVVIFVAIATILVIKEQFPQTGDEFGRLSASALALGAAGVGAFIGAATAPMLGARLERAGLILVGFGVSSVGLLSLGWVASLAAMLALALVTGYGTFVAKVAVDALVQEGMPDEYRGRAFSLYDILYNLASVVAAGFLVVFGVSNAVGAPLVAAGVCCVGAALAMRIAFKKAGMLGA